MTLVTQTHLSYFPGCSLATTAKENNASLQTFVDHFGITLTEVDDWNCCGSSSTHSVNSELAFSLAARNLFQAPPDKPMLIACPGCYLRLKHAQKELAGSKERQKTCEAQFNRPYNPDLKLIHFFELLADMSKEKIFKELSGRLKGLKIAPYYGCMLARPPHMNKEKNHHGLIEKTMAALGAESVYWSFMSRCCGTFLSVSRPEIAEKQVNRIMKGAIATGAECIVTACAMCHLNLEIRCLKENQIPIFHFSELLSLALEGKFSRSWLKRHLIDPVPLLEEKELLNGRASMRVPAIIPENP
jgi:heterodisulfide reductase subunit B2